MTKLLSLALLATTLAACAQSPAPPPSEPTADAAAVSSFVPYCGQVWSRDKQGYLTIPCPPGSNYPGGTNR